MGSESPNNEIEHSRRIETLHAVARVLVLSCRGRTLRSCLWELPPGHFQDIYDQLVAGHTVHPIKVAHELTDIDIASIVDFYTYERKQVLRQLGAPMDLEL